MPEKLYVIHALAPLHAGTGRGQDLIDLPIAREAATGHPLLPGSSVKGVLRAAVRETHGERADSLTWRLFGPDSDNAELHPGALRFSDARLLLLPVHSDRGTFAWVSSPMALARLARDAGRHAGLPEGAPPSVGAGQARVATKSAVLDGKTVQLRAVALNGVADLPDDWTDAIVRLLFPDDACWADMLRARLCLVDDDMFTWLTESATEVRARIRINPDTGTVADGALWYEEALPAESVLVGLVQGSSTHRRIRDGASKGQVERFADGAESLGQLAPFLAAPLQFGGNATVGMGLAQVHLRGGG